MPVFKTSWGLGPTFSLLNFLGGNQQYFRVREYVLETSKRMLIGNHRRRRKQLSKLSRRLDYKELLLTIEPILVSGYILVASTFFAINVSTLNIT